MCLSFSAAAIQKTITGSGKGETKQGSERDTQRDIVEEARTDLKEKVVSERRRKNDPEGASPKRQPDIPTFNIAASQRAASYRFLSWLSRGPSLSLIVLHYSPLSALILYSPGHHFLPQLRHSHSLSLCLFSIPYYT